METQPHWWTRVGSTVEGLFGRASTDEAAGSAARGPLSRRSGMGNGSEGALLQACTRGSAEEVERLLLEGANPNHRGEFGATPLIKTSEQGHAAIVALLLAHGTEVNSQDDNGDSALLCACRMGHLEAVRLLLTHGADPALANSQSNNALDAALEARNLLGRPEVSEVLLAHRRECDEVVAATSEVGTAPEGADVPSGASTDRTLLSAVSWLPPRLRPKEVPNAAAPLLPTVESSKGGSSMGAHHGARGKASAGSGGPGSPGGSLDLVFRGGRGGGGSGRGNENEAVAPVLRLRREEWAQDKNYPQCHLCKSNFTLINRRHHCRICGLVFCEKCTANSVTTAGARDEAGELIASDSAPVRVRVCNNCATLHAEHAVGASSKGAAAPSETREVSTVGYFTDRLRRGSTHTLAHIGTAVSLARAATYEATSMKAPRSSSASAYTVDGRASALGAARTQSARAPPGGGAGGAGAPEEVGSLRRDTATLASERTAGDAEGGGAACGSGGGGGGGGGGDGGGSGAAAEAAEAPSSPQLTRARTESAPPRPSLGSLAESEVCAALGGASAASPLGRAESHTDLAGFTEQGSVSDVADPMRATVDAGSGHALLAPGTPPSDAQLVGGGRSQKHRRSHSVPSIADLIADGKALAAGQRPPNERILQKGGRGGTAMTMVSRASRPLPSGSPLSLSPLPLPPLPSHSQVSLPPPLELPPSEPEPEALVVEHRARLASWRDMRLRHAIWSQLSLYPTIPTQWQGAWRARASASPQAWSPLAGLAPTPL